MSSEVKVNGDNKLLVLALSSVVAIGGITFKLVLERMDKQETRATLDISALRKEIENTKADAKESVAATTANLSENILLLRKQLEKVENKIYSLNERPTH